MKKYYKIDDGHYIESNEESFNFESFLKEYLDYKSDKYDISIAFEKEGFKFNIFKSYKLSERRQGHFFEILIDDFDGLSHFLNKDIRTEMSSFKFISKYASPQGTGNLYRNTNIVPFILKLSSDNNFLYLRLNDGRGKIKVVSLNDLYNYNQENNVLNNGSVSTYEKYSEERRN